MYRPIASAAEQGFLASPAPLDPAAAAAVCASPDAAYPPFAASASASAPPHPHHASTSSLPSLSLAGLMSQHAMSNPVDIHQQGAKRAHGDGSGSGSGNGNGAYGGAAMPRAGGRPPAAPQHPWHSDDDDDDDDDAASSIRDRDDDATAAATAAEPVHEPLERRRVVDDFSNELMAIERKLQHVALEEPHEKPPTEALTGFESLRDPHRLENLLHYHTDALRSALASDVPEYKLSALKRLRKFLCLPAAEHNTLEPFLEAGFLPLLRPFVLDATHPEHQYEAVWCITNVTAGPHAACRAVVDLHLVPPLNALLLSDFALIRIHAAWALGNLAGDGDEEFRYGIVTQPDLVHRLVNLWQVPTATNQDEVRQALTVGMWAFGNLCRFQEPVYTLLEPAFPTLKSMILADDEDMVAEAAWALSRVMKGQTYEIALLAQDREITDRFLDLLGLDLNTITNPVLRALANMTAAPATAAPCTAYLMQNGLLAHLARLLHTGYHRAIRSETLFVLANMLAANVPSLVEEMEPFQLFERVVGVLWENEFRLQREAVWVLWNACADPATPQVKALATRLIQYKALPPLIAFIAASFADPDAQTRATECVDFLLRMASTPHPQNPLLSQRIDDAYFGDVGQAFTSLWNTLVRLRENNVYDDDDDDDDDDDHRGLTSGRGGIGGSMGGGGGSLGGGGAASWQGGAGRSAPLSAGSQASPRKAGMLEHRQLPRPLADLAVEADATRKRTILLLSNLLKRYFSAESLQREASDAEIDAALGKVNSVSLSNTAP
ncbi:hypothetical protein CXG81DRAFT_18532 [Caulochytrium protostelioides]|uniref:ARM repeat-containing protein n=1 Tax=Caulochytrium protostelioides TaxID=1555241 RepID=A0A4P9X8S6_9FUNG|nr:hypothetical protein CXG81DRAFT_18532 [Caulochytrium protostelioides]|eukprot:RKP01714.1 hypothetical protein CXG81DRAFT_18532 [Caulochytrium protostelioides]